MTLGPTEPHLPLAAPSPHRAPGWGRAWLRGWRARRPVRTSSGLEIVPAPPTAPPPGTHPAVPHFWVHLMPPHRPVCIRRLLHLPNKSHPTAACPPARKRAALLLNRKPRQPGSQTPCSAPPDYSTSPTYHIQQHRQVPKFKLAASLWLQHRKGVNVSRLVCHQKFLLGGREGQGRAPPHHGPGRPETPTVGLHGQHVKGRQACKPCVLQTRVGSSPGVSPPGYQGGAQNAATKRRKQSQCPRNISL